MPDLTAAGPEDSQPFLLRFNGARPQHHTRRVGVEQISLNTPREKVLLDLRHEFRRERSPWLRPTAPRLREG